MDTAIPVLTCVRRPATDCFALESANIHAVKTTVSLSPWSRSLVEPWSLHLKPLGKNAETSRTCVGAKHGDALLQDGASGACRSRQHVRCPGSGTSGEHLRPVAKWQEDLHAAQARDAPEELLQRIVLAYMAREVRCSPAYDHLRYSLASDVVPRM